MSRTGWKQAERDAASILHGARYPANTGAEVDVESARFVAQVKARRTLSFAHLELLCEGIERTGIRKKKVGIVMLKRSAGKGRETEWLVCMTAGAFKILLEEEP